MDKVVPIRKSAFQEAMELLEEYKPKQILIVILDHEDQVHYIPPPSESIYEIVGWLEAVKQDILIP